jgi:ribonuclease D
MPQQISSFQMNPSPIRAVNVNLSDWGTHSISPIEISYDAYSQTLNLNVHRALQDVCNNQSLLNNAIHQFSVLQYEVLQLKTMMNEWKELIEAYHTSESVRKSIDQIKLVAKLQDDK